MASASLESAAAVSLQPGHVDGFDWCVSWPYGSSWFSADCQEPAWCLGIASGMAGSAPVGGSLTRSMLAGMIGQLCGGASALCAASKFVGVIPIVDCGGLKHTNMMVPDS